MSPWQRELFTILLLLFTGVNSIYSIVTRGSESAGRVMEEQPGFPSPAHMLNLFTVDEPPNASIQTKQQFIDWINDPAHSYTVDGTGGIALMAHARPGEEGEILRLNGLVGIGVSRWLVSDRWDRFWDTLLTRCHDANKPYLGIFGEDDTHSSTNIGLMWTCFRLDELTEVNLKRAFRSGAFYTSCGPVILDIQVSNRTISVTLSSRGEVRWVKAGQYGLQTPTVTNQLGLNKCLKLDTNVTTSSYTLNDSDGTTSPLARYIRFIVRGNNGYAWSMPFKITSSGEIENPYPPSGNWYKGQVHNHIDATEDAPLSQIKRYYDNYARRGYAFTFATEYALWKFPFKKYPPNVTPLIKEVSPDRAKVGENIEITIKGDTFKNGCYVKIGPVELPSENITYISESEIRFLFINTLPVGKYDVSVINSDFKDTLPYGFTVQEPNADNNGWKTYTTNNSRLGSNKVYDILSVDNEVWIATNNGVNKVVGNEWQLYTRRHLGRACVYRIAVDRQGNKWFATLKGVARLSPEGRWRRWTELNLEEREILSIAAISEDEVWATTERDGVARFDGERWIPYTAENSSLAHNNAFYVYIDRNGNKWFCLEHRGLQKYDNNNWTRYTTGLISTSVYRICEDQAGNLWIATADTSAQGRGISMLNPVTGQCTNYPPSSNGLVHGRVWAVFVDSKNNKWFGTSIGVSKLTANGEWINYNTLNSGLAYDFVLDIEEDSQGNIWFATGRGVSVYTQRATIDEIKKKNKTSGLLNYFNPFNPAYFISVGKLKKGTGRVKIRIYNILGELIREINTSNLASPNYWSGENTQGLRVPSGVYFYEVVGQGVGRIVVIK
jgi:streptogramin lyase